MPRALLYILCLLLLAFTGKKHVAPSDWDKYGLNGKVKSLKETRYYARVKDSAIVKEEIRDNSYASYLILFNASGFITEYHALYPKKSVNTRKVYSYNEGKLAEINEYNAEDSLKVKQSFSYDKEGRLTEESTYRNKKFFEKRLYEYDADGRRTSLTHKVSWSKKVTSWQYSYDAQGRMSASVLYEGKSKKKARWKETHVYAYTSDGRLRLDSVLTWPGKFSEKTVYTYDASERRKEAVSYDEDGDMIWKESFQYDEQGNITERSTYENTFGLQYFDKSYAKYVYDTQGNWTQKTSFDVNLYPTIITERVIEYYSP
ncbi:MAG: hypothetical protein AB1458_06920 [Bacteroidota bacterium]